MVDHLVFRDTKLAGLFHMQSTGTYALVRILAVVQLYVFVVVVVALSAFTERSLKSTLQMIFSAFLITSVLSFELTVACSVFVLVLFFRSDTSFYQESSGRREVLFTSRVCSVEASWTVSTSQLYTVREITLYLTVLRRTSSPRRLRGRAYPVTCGVAEIHETVFSRGRHVVFAFKGSHFTPAADTGNAKSFVDEHGSVA